MESQQVILGGGRRHWLPKVTRDVEQTTDEGRRLDGRNLVDDWLRDKKKRGLKAEFLWNKQQLDNVSSDIEHLLGKFYSSRVVYFTVLLFIEKALLLVYEFFFHYVVNKFYFFIQLFVLLATYFVKIQNSDLYVFKS